MLQISVWRDENNKIISCEIKGHAQAGVKGSDIVCAAVSALTETALLGLGKYVKADLDYKVKSGFMMFSLKDSPCDKTDAVLETMLLGLEEIARIYKKNVVIEHYRR